MSDNRTTERVDHPQRVREAIDELMCKKDAWDERMSELKPCPFCGGEAELTGFDAPEFWVWCPNCKASTDAHTCKGGAIEAWNTRADDYRQAAEYWQRMYEEQFAERTCKNVDDEFPFFKCSECGCYAVVGSENSGDGLPNYCPNCGRKVVSE